MFYHTFHALVLCCNALKNFMGSMRKSSNIDRDVCKKLKIAEEKMVVLGYDKRIGFVRLSEKQLEHS